MKGQAGTGFPVHAFPGIEADTPGAFHYQSFGEMGSDAGIQPIRGIDKDGLVDIGFSMFRTVAVIDSNGE
ncbi:MAG: hypothetical protein IPP79_05115 [Chitinophagaceae bacterium]|nr:hypothetical protein [Chitinophagaceae bacterium]